MAHMLPLSATAGVDGKLLIWDTASLSVRATCQHPEVCSNCLSCCPLARPAGVDCRPSKSRPQSLCLHTGHCVSAVCPSSS